MSPILKRVIDHNRRNNFEKYLQKSYVDLPHATLDLSGGDMFGGGGGNAKVKKIPVKQLKENIHH